MFDWNDLRYFLAVAEHGGSNAAARALGVDPTTVQRRLAELERGLGQALVQRLPGGYRLTEFGQQLLGSARGVADAAAALERQAVAARRDVSGTLRLTCPEPIMQRLSRSGLIERFHARHPGLRVEFVMSDRYLDLALGEADVALRSGDTDDGALVGRKIGDSLWAVFASRGYVERHGAPADAEALAGHALVAFDESMARHRASVWLDQTVPRGRVVARSDSVLGVLQGVKSGLGVAPLPMPIGDAEPDLVRLFGPVPELARIWRLLTTQALRHTPRVAAFFDFVTSELDALQPVLSG